MVVSRKIHLCVRPTAQRPLMLPTSSRFLPFYRELRLPVHIKAEQIKDPALRELAF